MSRLKRLWRRLPVRNGWLALILLNLAVLLSGLESAYVQAVTTYQAINLELFTSPSFLFLLCLDLLFPLIVALFSRRAFFVYLVGQCFLSTILLHYTIFFYNPLTLSTIYHSMQGAASLGIDIFGFARPDIILALGALLALKLLLVQLSRAPERRMPRFWNLRGITAVCAMAVVFMISSLIYGKTGLSLLWVDSIGHRTATERRQQGGTTEAVRNIGYLATWIGEWISGTYKDTDLIYAEHGCVDPDEAWRGASVTGEKDGLALTEADGTKLCAAKVLEPSANLWNGLPLPPPGRNVVLIQAESLDFAALDLRVNGHSVLPFLDLLARDSLLLRVFAPHKVGSSNSDYELLNGRVAEQNVIYYSYITEYPDSVIHLLTRRGYNTSVYHGLSGDLFNLREAYRAQGFSRLYFKEELLEAGYKPGKYIMEHIMDADVFGLALENLQHRHGGENASKELPEPATAPSSGGQAQFIVTMSSHIPFMDPNPLFKSAGGSFSRYVSSLRYLDQCLAAYYSMLPEGTLLIIWGDHGSDVVYPQGFTQNSRHVPFMVHLKGNVGWLEEWERERKESIGAEHEVTGSTELIVNDSGFGWGQDTPYETYALSSMREYRLCELHYYLRRIFE